jgi:hypothetical protein
VNEIARPGMVEETIQGAAGLWQDLSGSDDQGRYCIAELEKFYSCLILNRLILDVTQILPNFIF